MMVALDFGCSLDVVAGGSEYRPSPAPPAWFVVEHFMYLGREPLVGCVPSRYVRPCSGLPRRSVVAPFAGQSLLF